MSEIKIKHEGGDKKGKPTSGATHKEQKPGKAAEGVKTGHMSWSGREKKQSNVAKFDAAISFVLKHEGNYVCDPEDSGGATNHGISLRFYKTKIKPDATVDDIKNLSVNSAIDIYRKYFWDNYQYDSIDDQLIASKLFDLGVNMGPPSAGKCLQRAVNVINPDANLVIDGILMAKSFDAINACDPDSLYPELINQAKIKYEKIASVGDNEKFLHGWLNRLTS